AIPPLPISPLFPYTTLFRSIQAFDSVYIDVVITLFMFLAGINFAMHFRLLSGDRKTFFRNRETRFYTLITVISIIIVSSSLAIFNNYSIGSALRYGSFRSEERRVGKEWTSSLSPSYQSRELYETSVRFG